jgi:hypothetical protein
MRTVKPTREAMLAQPWRPFSLQMVDGTVHAVQHHDWLSIPPVRQPREAIYFVTTEHPEEDETRWLDIGRIAEVIIPPGPAEAAAQPKPEGNGG